MVNVELLNQKIVESGLKRKYLASCLGLSVYGLSYKLKGKREFTGSEIAVLCEKLNISKLTEKEAIFFAKNVDKLSTKED